MKFGDARSTMTLINDLSNLKTESRELIKHFNSGFNSLLNKIPAMSKPVKRFEVNGTFLPYLRI